MKVKIQILFAFIMLYSACDKMDVSPEQEKTFIKFFSNYPDFSAVNVEQAGISGYAILGTAGTYENGKQICLIRTDEYGNSIDTARYYGRSLNDQAYCFKVMPDGGFAILGSSENPSNGTKEVLFIRTDETGEPLWTRIIGETRDVEALHFDVDPNGSFFMIGYSVEESAPSVLSKDIWYFALDSNGDNLWPNPRTRPGVNDDAGTCIRVLSNGALVLTGKTKSYPVPSAYDHAFICKANSLGIITSGISTLNSYFTDESASVQIDEDDNIYMVGSVIPTSGDDKEILLAKFSYNVDNLVTHWVTNFENSGNDSGSGIIVNNGNLHVLGTVAREGSNTSIAVITADLYGEIQKSSFYGTGVQMRSADFNNAVDNSLIITGTNAITKDYSAAVFIKTTP